MIMLWLMIFLLAAMCGFQFAEIKRLKKLLDKYEVLVARREAEVLAKYSPGA
jgi:membrane-bound acyltransferase YfiQ involved in biofilm formation